LHSFLISHAVRRWSKRVLGPSDRYFRICFIIISIVTIVPVIIYSRQVTGEVVFAWNGLLEYARWVLLILSAWLFLAGARVYDMRIFAGIAQLSSTANPAALTESGTIIRRGILKHSRHPWYLASVLGVWAFEPVVDLPGLVVRVILTVYLIVGTYLEERKLVAELGDEYRRYQDEVSMFIPLKWLRRK